MLEIAKEKNCGSIVILIHQYVLKVLNSVHSGSCKDDVVGNI